MRLQGRVAIVTGATGDVGAAIAWALAQEGARVVVTARGQARLDALAAEVQATGAQCLPVAADLTREDEVQGMVATVAERLGNIDILVNNAGMVVPQGPVAEMDLSIWNGALALNLTGAMLCCREVLRHMLARGQGVILNIGATSSRRGFPMSSAYSSSKWGLIGLTQALAQEVGAFGIRVNCLCPGTVEGPHSRSAFEARAAARGVPYETVAGEIAARSSMGRFVTPAEVAVPALFLVSDDASGITGQALNVNAGTFMS